MFSVPAPRSLKPRLGLEYNLLGYFVLVVLLSLMAARAGTLWLFNEQVGVYPSSVLNDSGPHSYFLILGRGGELVPGKFGDALQAMKPAPFDPHFKPGLTTAVRDGLEAPKMMPGRTVAPLSWETATFAAAYTGGEFTTKPLRFTNSRLVLNIDTNAAGYAQVGFVDESGRPIPGFGVDECVYIKGDEINYPVEWMNPKFERTNDASALAGRTVRFVVRLHGASLYALQFTDLK